MEHKQIVRKLNNLPLSPHMEFNQEEVEYIVARWIETHSKNKVKSVNINSPITVKVEVDNNSILKH